MAATAAWYFIKKKLDKRDVPTSKLYPNCRG
jgi:hypothetical protein